MIRWFLLSRVARAIDELCWKFQKARVSAFYDKTDNRGVRFMAIRFVPNGMDE